MAFAGSEKPTVEQIQKSILGVQLSYACCGEQDFGIALMAKAFGAKFAFITVFGPNLMIMAIFQLL